MIALNMCAPLTYPMRFTKVIEKSCRLALKKAPLLNVSVQRGSLKITHTAHAIIHIRFALNEADGAL